MMQGQVAGQSRAAQNHLHAFITGADGEDMTDLNSLVDLPQGMILSESYGYQGQQPPDMPSPLLPAQHALA